MANFIVTTIRKPDIATETFADELSLKLGGNFVKREDFSFDRLKKIHGVEIRREHGKFYRDDDSQARHCD